MQALFPFWAGSGARIIGWEYHGHDGHDLVGGRMAGWRPSMSWPQGSRKD